tara:strand:+ start:713 stop:871 length:159 start_codon:yes stop_codon:yes gene_type:complete
MQDKNIFTRLILWSPFILEEFLYDPIKVFIQSKLTETALIEFSYIVVIKPKK